MLLDFHCCALVNSQVSVYRTIGPTLVIISIRLEDWNVFARFGEISSMQGLVKFHQ